MRLATRFPYGSPCLPNEVERRRFPSWAQKCAVEQKNLMELPFPRAVNRGWVVPHVAKASGGMNNVDVQPECSGCLFDLDYPDLMRLAPWG